MATEFPLDVRLFLNEPPKRRTPNAERRTPNAERRTVNRERRTVNARVVFHFIVPMI